MTRFRLLVLLLFLLRADPGFSQSAVPFGLPGKIVRDLAVSALPVLGNRYIYAVTDTWGAYRRALDDSLSNWECLGLLGKDLRSVDLYRWGVGPVDFEIPVVGVRTHGQDSTLICRLADAGWVPADSGIDHTSIREIRALVSFASGGHMPPAPAFAAGGGVLYRSDDFPFYWRPVYQVGMGVINAICLADRFALCGEMWIGGENAIFAPWIARSWDCGQTWDTSFPDMAGDNACDALAVHPRHQDVVYAGMEGAVIVSTDSGRTWWETNLRDQPVYFFGLAVDPSDSRHVWAGGAVSPGDSWAMWESYDAGRTWLRVSPEALFEVSGISKIVADPLEPGTVYVATLGQGVWVYRSRYEWDAVILALRLQEGGVRLDTRLAAELSRVLSLARTVDDSLADIHAFPDYDPTCLLLSSSADWTRPWLEGELWTGFAPIDSLGREFGLAYVEPLTCGAGFALHFDQPLRIPALAELCRGIPGVESAGPSHFGGDGDRIEAFRKGDLWYVVFSRGWGDCPSGCIYRKYWYVLVRPDSSAELAEVWERDFSEPRVHRWNIPPRYPATCFANLYELFAALGSPDWWVRRHAAEVLGRLAVHDAPWVSEDEVHRDRFDRLRDAVLSERGEVLQRLRPLLLDPDPDVRVSTRTAMNRILRLDPDGFSLYFPLHVGNRWTFDRGDEWLVEDSVRVDSLTYFRLSSSGQFGSILVRMTEGGQLRAFDGDSEQVWLAFAAGVGSRWLIRNQQGLSWTVELQSVNDTVSVPAGEFVGCYRFWYHFSGRDADWVEWYAPGVGPVKRILFGFAVVEYNLVSANVAGIEIPTSVVGSGTGGSVPGNRVLVPCHPNPFNASTLVRYELPRPGRVRLAILDVRGRVVRTLVSGSKPRGEHQVRWDGTDDAGRLLPSGVYLVRLQATGRTAVQKVALVR